MQPKSWLVLATTSVALGLMVGLFAAGRLAAKQGERYTEDVLSYARYVQAKGRANLVRFLETKDIQKAQDLLYIVLRDNFKDYADAAHGEDRTRACVESIRSATTKCAGNRK